MTNQLSVLRIVLAIAVYFAVAAAAAVVSRRLGANIKSMEGRTAGAAQAVGIVANAVILLLVLGLLTFVDRRPISTLGLRFAWKDLAFLLSAGLATLGLALCFVAGMARLERSRVTVRRRRIGREGMPLVGVASVLLLVVSLQEEALFRGYVGLNLPSSSAGIVLVVTTAIFTAIHLPTNAISPWQILGWAVSGLFLGASYLASGSIWIAVGLHFLTDFLNVLVFNVAGTASVYEFEPPLAAWHRTVFRLFQAALSIGLLFLFYGFQLKVIQ